MAATAPATTAVAKPACAPKPDATPKASARGKATMATVTPAMRSRFGSRLTAFQSERPGRSEVTFRQVVRAGRPATVQETLTSGYRGRAFPCEAPPAGPLGW